MPIRNPKEKGKMKKWTRERQLWRLLQKWSRRHPWPSAYFVMPTFSFISTRFPLTYIFVHFVVFGFLSSNYKTIVVFFLFDVCWSMFLLIENKIFVYMHFEVATCSLIFHFRVPFNYLSYVLPVNFSPGRLGKNCERNEIILCYVSKLRAERKRENNKRKWKVKRGMGMNS